MRNDLETIKAELNRLQRRVGKLPATDSYVPGGEEADPSAIFTREQRMKLANTLSDVYAQIICAEVAARGFSDY